MEFKGLRYLVVGAGFWGGVLAERIASGLGERVLVIDERPHSGGNCHSFIHAETGIECHAYGSHIFHTKRRAVWDYANRFSAFTNYRHRVFTEYQGRVYPMPISLATLNSFYGLNLKPYEVEGFVRKEAEGNPEPDNLEAKAVSLIGRPLYEAFIKGYTQKQWGQEPRRLPPEIITRLPVRANYDNDYFTDPWQGMPVDGYAALFKRLFDQPRLELKLNTSYADIRPHLDKETKVFYSGPLDALFDYKHGPLEWRSLEFDLTVEPYADFQGTAVLNRADLAVEYTRSHEYKHLHPERGAQGDKSVVVYEYPRNFTLGAERYYPVNTAPNEKRLALYREELAGCPNLTAGGRLGAYRYMDMDATIAAALELADTLRA